MKTEVKKATSSSTCLFQPAVSNNIGKYLLFLIQKYFPNNRKYHKVFNKNNVKIIYSSMENIKSIINVHNKEVITEKIQVINCNCIDKPDCLRSNQIMETYRVNLCIHSECGEIRFRPS